MKIQDAYNYNILEKANNTNENIRYFKEARPDLKDLQIKMDNAVFSKEGMEALREQTQFKSANIDIEETMRIREILPKLKFNPSDDFLWAMRKDMQNSLNMIKEAKGDYTLDDYISVHMNAYEKQYHALKDAYADGSREIYISEGMDENGKLKYHEVTQEEDFAYLDQAFDRVAQSMVFSAESEESILRIKEHFGGARIPLLDELPEDHGERLADILRRAAKTYSEQTDHENSMSAAEIARKYLNEDAEFASVMRRLYAEAEDSK